MLVSMKWLQELVEVGIPVPQLVDRLDLTGTAVEAVRTAGEALDGVVVGKILEKARHPEADRLWVTQVDVGGEAPLQIVCGAQNFEEGDLVAVALVGAALPNGLTIKKAKLRGVASEGMNCSAEELGLGGDHDGIMILPADARVGTPFAQYMGLADTILELEITPNRPDCMSVAGVAREVAAILGETASMPASSPEETGAPAEDEFSVEIEDPQLCPRYTARLIRNVKIGPSPAWLAERVQAAGARSINNVVDITNYVMFELGQPLHAFDADTLARDGAGRVTVGVRVAREGETLRTLDGQDRELTPDTLLITDASGPIALAGVMGGESTEVGDATTNILLESASFSAPSISRTRRRLSLLSEASARFERGVDAAGCAAALDRAAALMAECASGEVAPGIVDAYPLPSEPREITLRISRVHAILGHPVTAEETSAILSSLGCEVSGTAEELRVLAPTFRSDLEREIDLIEEVLRVFGMDRVESTLPAGRGRVGGLTREQRWRERVGVTLRACGLNETMTYSLADPEDTARLRDELAEGETPCELLNPMSAEQSVLRRSLLPGLLRSVSYNQRRGVANVHLYEIGTAFTATKGRKQPKERTFVGAVLSGAWHDAEWHDPAVALDFFDGKGVIEAIVREIGAARFKVRPAERPYLQPGRAAEVLLGGEVAGWLGEVHPLVAETFDVTAPVVAFELDLAGLVRAAQDVKPFADVPRYPAVDLDVALVVPEDVSAERLEQAARSAGGRLLESVRVFDVYRGKGVAEGRKSIALALTYRSPERTLTADEVESVHARLVGKVAGAVGGELRA